VPERAAGRLELLRQAKVADLLGDAPDTRLEASGVVAVDDLLYVIFDNLAGIARLDGDLQPATPANGWIRTAASERGGREDIAHDPASGRFYVLVEAARRGPAFMARVEEYDDEGFERMSSRWLRFPLTSENKGLEGLTCVRRDGETYLLGLCEGNRCKGGKAGSRPGGGRLQVFRRGRRHWKHVDTIRLPESLWFEDYSSVAVAGDRLGVVSQSSAALWVGALAPSAWRVRDAGSVFEFPRDADGRTVYCNVEGVAWLPTGAVAVVSDRAKPTQKRRCRANDQSVQVFGVPD
jgi:hypothetical protein